MVEEELITLPSSSSSSLLCPSSLSSIIVNTTMMIERQRRATDCSSSSFKKKVDLSLLSFPKLVRLEAPLLATPDVCHHIMIDWNKISANLKIVVSDDYFDELDECLNHYIYSDSDNTFSKNFGIKSINLFDLVHNPINRISEAHLICDDHKYVFSSSDLRRLDRKGKHPYFTHLSMDSLMPSSCFSTCLSLYSYYETKMMGKMSSSGVVVANADAVIASANADEVTSGNERPNLEPPINLIDPPPSLIDSGGEMTLTPNSTQPHRHHHDLESQFEEAMLMYYPYYTNNIVTVYRNKLERHIEYTMTIIHCILSGLDCIGTEQSYQDMLLGNHSFNAFFDDESEPSHHGGGSSSNGNNGNSSNGNSYPSLPPLEGRYHRQLRSSNSMMPATGATATTATTPTTTTTELLSEYFTEALNRHLAHTISPRSNTSAPSEPSYTGINSFYFPSIGPTVRLSPVTLTATRNRYNNFLYSYLIFFEELRKKSTEENVRYVMVILYHILDYRNKQITNGEELYNNVKEYLVEYDHDDLYWSIILDRPNYLRQQQSQYHFKNLIIGNLYSNSVFPQYYQHLIYYLHSEYLKLSSITEHRVTCRQLQFYKDSKYVNYNDLLDYLINASMDDNLKENFIHLIRNYYCGSSYIFVTDNGIIVDKGRSLRLRQL